MNDSLLTDKEKLQWLLEAVGHVGVDFGYGAFHLNDDHIETARELHKKISDNQLIITVKATSD